MPTRKSAPSSRSSTPSSHSSKTRFPARNRHPSFPARLLFRYRNRLLPSRNPEQHLPQHHPQKDRDPMAGASPLQQRMQDPRPLFRNLRRHRQRQVHPAGERPLLLQSWQLSSLPRLPESSSLQIRCRQSMRKHQPLHRFQPIDNRHYDDTGNHHGDPGCYHCTLLK